jgi:hypothetical protein
MSEKRKAAEIAGDDKKAKNSATAAEAGAGEGGGGGKKDGAGKPNIDNLEEDDDFMEFEVYGASGVSSLPLVWTAVLH